MTAKKILVIDDEPDIRQVLQDVLEDEGYEIFTADSAESGDALFRERKVDLVLLDIWMTGQDGISLLKSWSDDSQSKPPVIMISGHGNVETAVDAIKYGAYDFLEKPLSTAKLLVTIQRAIEASELQEENLKLKGQLSMTSDLIGSSETMSQLRDHIERIARTESWVLVSGEPGSGKGVVARVLHGASSRKDGPLVELSLAATPRESIATRLFGNENEENVTTGVLEEAKGGTLVLDEIADIDIDVQGKLVSALEERRFLRTGGRTYIDIDVRIVATTNQDLLAAVNNGLFREDLYYRLNVVPIEVPPLREHIEDIPELVDYYLHWSVERDGLTPRVFSLSAKEALKVHHWPGNIRELKNLIHRLLILNKGNDISALEVKEAIGGAQIEDQVTYSDSVFDLSLRDARDEFERAYLNHHLNRVSGNVSELATIAGMERTHLYRKLKGLGIDPKKTENS